MYAGIEDGFSHITASAWYPRAHRHKQHVKTLLFYTNQLHIIIYKDNSVATHLRNRRLDVIPKRRFLKYSVQVISSPSYR